MAGSACPSIAAIADSVYVALSGLAYLPSNSWSGIPRHRCNSWFGTSRHSGNGWFHAPGLAYPGIAAIAGLTYFEIRGLEYLAIAGSPHQL